MFEGRPKLKGTMEFIGTPGTDEYDRERLKVIRGFEADLQAGTFFEKNPTYPKDEFFSDRKKALEWRDSMPAERRRRLDPEFK